jgi:nicotinamidase-related amidase
MGIKIMKNSISLFIRACLLALIGTTFVHAETPSQEPQTLLKMVGAKSEAARLSDSVLIIIDAQREYVDGKLRLDGIEASLKEASLVLERARKSGTPVIHIMHKGKAGGALFNPDGPYFEIANPVTPKPNETIVTKTLPNAFAGTNLDELLSHLGRKNLIVIGYMTHMCVSSTVRAALDRGYHTTVVAKATATRDLPATEGGIIPSQTLQRASLAALADRFATIVQSAQDIPE